MTYNAGDVLLVQFPFLELDASKKRPVLVLSSQEFHKVNKSFVAAMITTVTHSNWAGDTIIKDLKSAGLKHQCLIRLKLFTLPDLIDVKKIGILSKSDHAAFKKNREKFVSVT